MVPINIVYEDDDGCFEIIYLVRTFIHLHIWKYIQYIEHIYSLYVGYVEFIE